MEFAERLKLLIDKQFGGKVVSFAGAIGVSESNVRTYLKGVSPKVDIIANIARICGVSCSWLLLGEGDMKPDGATISAVHSQVAVGNGNKMVAGNNESAEIEFLKNKIKQLESDMAHKDEIIKLLQDCQKRSDASYDSLMVLYERFLNDTSKKLNDTDKQ